MHLLPDRQLFAAAARENPQLQEALHGLGGRQSLDLAAGEHTLTAGVAPAGDEEEIRWTVGIGNAADFQWIPDALIY